MAKRNRTLAGAALIAIATFAVYWPAIHGGFIWDDELLLTKNALVKASNGLYRIWFTREPIDYWPVTNSSFWIEWRLWGMNPTGYHVTNVLLHIGNALLAWALLSRLSIAGGFIAALLFAIHPVNVESVAWIAQRKNTLSMLFFLTSTLLYLQSPIGNRQSPIRYWLSFLAFVLAMLSKGSVVILPSILLLLVWWRQKRVRMRDVVETIPFWIAAITLTIVNIWFQHHGSHSDIRDATFVQRLLGAGAVPWFYLSKAIVPVRLMFVYPQWIVIASDPRWWLALAATLSTTALLFIYRRNEIVRALLFAWLFFCIALLPVMGFTDVYFMKYSLVADHYEYIALLAVCALAGAALAGKKRAGPPKQARSQ